MHVFLPDIVCKDKGGKIALCLYETLKLSKLLFCLRISAQCKFLIGTVDLWQCTWDDKEENDSCKICMLRETNMLDIC